MKYATLSVFLLFTLTLSAQYDRGQAYFAGSTAGAWQSTEYRLPNNPSRPNFSVPEDFSTIDFRSFRAGYFLLDQLLIGAQVDYWLPFYAPNSLSNDMGRLLLKPFARYYVLAGPERRVNWFGELGFGTVGMGDAPGFETDFHLGTGAEIQLRPGILGTANLNYNANASGLNFTTLDLGLNVLTGQLTGVGSSAPLASGTLTARGNLGTASYGRIKRGEAVDSDFTLHFSPSVGYFIARGLLLEFGTDLAASRRRNEIGGGIPELRNRNSLAIDLNLDARYYPIQQGWHLPYPYLTAGIGHRFQRQWFTDQGRRFQQDNNFGAWRVGAGLSYFLSPHLGLDVAVRYERGDESVANFDIDRRKTSFDRVRIAASVRFFLPRY